MIKILSTIILISTILNAVSFEDFLDDAINNSPYLKADELSISQAKQEGEILTRYANPTLGLEYSQFLPKHEDSQSGFMLNYTQAIRLLGVTEDKARLSDSLVQKASSKKELNRAEFIYKISELYIAYAQKQRYLLHAREELEIAKRIQNISDERYRAGNISKGKMLQAKIEYEIVEIKTKSLELDSMDSYFSLLDYANVSQDIKIDFTHKFMVKKQTDTTKNPNLLYLQKQREESLATYDTNSNSIEYFDMSVEYEHEVNQNILRVGASIPLAIFNTKSQERQIAKLQTQKLELHVRSKTTRLDVELKRLLKKRNLLISLKDENEKTLLNQVKLLKMFEEAYTIANTDILELQNIKNRVIKTKENIIQIDTTLNLNAISINYLTGANND